MMFFLCINNQYFNLKNKKFSSFIFIEIINKGLVCVRGPVKGLIWVRGPAKGLVWVRGPVKGLVWVRGPLKGLCQDQKSSIRSLNTIICIS